MSDAAPFAKGSVSLRLYPHNELDASAVVDEFCTQAALGLDGGFDGVMTSEHHGGWPGYFPGPLQMTGFILAATDRGWAAPCPLLLPLRPTVLVAEEVAWLDAHYPGRVGIGVGAGAVPLDFEAVGVPLEEAVPRFKAELPRLVDMLRGRDLRGLDADRAFQRCAEHPIPVLSAAVSPAAARRAAASDAGILSEGMSSIEKLAKLCATYDEAGGTGTKMLIRRVWLGEVRRELVAKQRAVYESVGSNRASSFGDDQTVASTDPSDMAARLADVVRTTGADAINLRVHLPGFAAEEIREQITRLAAEVVPEVRRLLAA